MVQNKSLVSRIQKRKFALILYISFCNKCLILLNKNNMSPSLPVLCCSLSDTLSVQGDN